MTDLNPITNILRLAQMGLGDGFELRHHLAFPSGDYVVVLYKVFPSGTFYSAEHTIPRKEVQTAQDLDALGGRLVEAVKDLIHRVPGLQPADRREALRRFLEGK